MAGFISEEIGFSNGLSLIGIFSLAFFVIYFSVLFRCNRKVTRTVPVTDYINSEVPVRENETLEMIFTNKVLTAK